MSLKAELGPHFPYLRRYARALTGSQMRGDGAVREMLQSLLAAPEAFDNSRPPRQELFRLFHKLWHGLESTSEIGGIMASLSLAGRHALLLTAVEGFTIAQVAEILDCTITDVAGEIDTARHHISDSVKANVLIIEDEAIIALHIRSIVEDLGHAVIGIARTRSEAAELAAQEKPELVLADISLADGSSGIDAVKDILAMMDVPAIFITAFPERLLTGERPEPTYLIAKPFNPETVAATIGQALLFHRELAAVADTSARDVLEDETPNPRKHYASPEALLADPDLADDEKQALLIEWNSEMDARLNAESEGMGVSDPMTARKEARLADEAGHARSSLTAIGEIIAKP